jgi:hypothetical protein
MPQFPSLKTGAVMQYPAVREFQYSAAQLNFLDGSGQRYRMGAGSLRRWLVSLELLDPSEVQDMETFFIECRGSFGEFSFVDPEDGTEYEHCSLEQPDLQIAATEEMRYSTTLVIRQNR